MQHNPLIFTLLLCLISVPLQAQIPDAFNYQAVVRDAEGNLRANEELEAIVAILGTRGNVLYRESHRVTTSAYGQITLVVGEGDPLSGTFADIYWPDIDAHLQVDLRFEDRTTYQLPATPLQSAPYAIWSAKPWELGNDERLYYLNGPVGIGTEQPQAMLEISTEDDTSLRLTARGFGAGDPAVELVRGSEGTGTDWRMRNDGGVLSFDSTIDNFGGEEEPVMQLYRTGTLALGTTDPEAPIHMRRESGDAGILLQASANGSSAFVDLVGGSIANGGSGSGTDFRIAREGVGFDDYLVVRQSTTQHLENAPASFSISRNGNVGVGNFTTPGADLHVRGSGEQEARIESTSASNAVVQLDNNLGRWEIQNNFAGFFRIFSEPTSSGASTLLSAGLDADDQLRLYREINMEDHRIVNLADPAGAQQAVNRRFMENYVEQEIDDFAAQQHNGFRPRSLSDPAPSTRDFRACVAYCRALAEDGHDDWSVPTAEEATYYLGLFSGAIWTCTPSDYLRYYTIINNFSGPISTSVTQDSGCRCVR